MKSDPSDENENIKKRKVEENASLSDSPFNRFLKSLQINWTFFENAPIPICIFKPDKSIFYVNQALQKVSGFSSQELLGKYPPFPYWSQDQLDTINREFNLAFENESNSELAKFTKKSGEDFWVRVSTTHLTMNNHSDYAISSWVDITELQKSEQNLKKANHYNRVLIDYSFTPILVLNKDASVSYINPSFETLTGYTLNEVRNIKPPFPWWVTESQDEYMNALLKSMKTRHAKKLYNIVTSDKSTIWIRAESAITKQEYDDIFYIETWTALTEFKKGQDTLAYYISQINNIQERERTLISQELHDEYLQIFSAIRIKLSALADKVTNMDKPKIGSKISELDQELSVALRKFRNFTQKLRPFLIIDEMGLMTALDNLVSDVNTNDNLQLSLIVSGNEFNFTLDQELIIYRIIQESVRNIVKHADSTNARIKISYFTNHASFNITDNGKGFDQGIIEANEINRKTMGLVSIRERISLLSGTLTIKSTPGRGTTIKFKIPYH